eukprot:5934913-Pleurochrysis_carterae.AAC.2
MRVRSEKTESTKDIWSARETPCAARGVLRVQSPFGHRTRRAYADRLAGRQRRHSPPQPQGSARTALAQPPRCSRRAACAGSRKTRSRPAGPKRTLRESIRCTGATECKDAEWRVANVFRCAGLTECKRQGCEKDPRSARFVKLHAYGRLN